MQVAAHNGWITGMDLASASGLLLSCAEDSYVRVWQLSGRGPLVEHWFSAPVTDCLMAGAKFLDPRGSSFCVSAYDSSVVQVRREESSANIGAVIVLTLTVILLKGFRNVILLLSREKELECCYCWCCWCCDGTLYLRFNKHCDK